VAAADLPAAAGSEPERQNSTIAPSANRRHRAAKNRSAVFQLSRINSPRSPARRSSQRRCRAPSPCRWSAPRSGSTRQPARSVRSAREHAETRRGDRQASEQHRARHLPDQRDRHAAVRKVIASVGPKPRRSTNQPSSRLPAMPPTRRCAGQHRLRGAVPASVMITGSQLARKYAASRFMK